MKKLNVGFLLMLSILSGCIVLPVSDETVNARCEISSDKKVLKIVNLSKETNSYFTIDNMLLSPIAIPATAVISGIYTTINNIYYLGEEKINCGK